MEGNLNLEMTPGMQGKLTQEEVPLCFADMAFYGEQAAALRTRPFRAPDVRDELLKQDALRVGMWCACACIVLWMERMWLRCGKSR